MVTLKVSLTKRVEKLEEAFGALQPKDDWTDFYMWGGRDGGIFGHSHYRVWKSRGEILHTPCTDEEELEIMRAHYEDEGRKLPGGSAEVSFAEYLKWFNYLCSEVLAERQKVIIECVRRETLANGSDQVRTGD